MHALQEIPEGYREIFSVNLQKDKRTAVLINIAAAAIMIAMFIIGHLFVPVSMFLDMEQGIGAYLLRSGVLVIGMIAYIILHEMVHGIAMKCLGCKKVKFGFTGLYAFAGCDDYFNKRDYIIIAIAPIAVWGVILAVMNCLVQTEWFWVVYFIQICNISGAVGDLYVIGKFAKMPSDILVRDSGVGMVVYSKE